MTYKICKKTKNFFKKASTTFIVFCTFYLLFFSHLYAQVLPSCKGLTSPNPGVNCLPNCDDPSISDPKPGANCLYFDLPICTTNSYATTSITSPNPRVNCADLIDLPLCNNFNYSGNIDDDPSDVDRTFAERKNCVLECAEIAEDSSKIRGVDYARHGIDCIRFKGTLSNGSPTTESFSASYNALAEDKKYTEKKCHQSVEGYTDPGSCELLSCNLLTLEELSEPKFSEPNNSKTYCDGSEKCFNFAQNKLRYLRPSATQTLCQPHECQPAYEPLTSYIYCNDETNNVIARGNDFVLRYEQYIMGINPDVTPLASLSAADNNLAAREQLKNSCTTRTQTCKKIINRKYYCNDNGLPNSQCQTACDADNKCSKPIDCNNPALASEPECIMIDGDSDTTSEMSDAWFFNPKPASNATNNIGELHKMNTTNMCYSKQDLEDNNWGKRLIINMPSPIADLDLGYYHSSIVNDPRSPGHCSALKNNIRGAGYAYLCGNDLDIYKKVSSDTGYHNTVSTGEFVDTTFTNTDTISKVKVCLRFKNLNLPYNATGEEICGKRQCSIECTGALGCTGQYCGSDECVNLTVKETEATKCIMDSGMFNSDNSDYDCAQIIDNFLGIGGMLRVRAVQYSNKICTFLDSNGQLAYNKMFMDGKETLSDGTCLGKTNGSGNCSGKDSNDEETLAHKWRAVMRIPFIEHDSKLDQNPNFSGASGYLNVNGQLVKAQECIHVPLRARTPRLYNLATTRTSSRLFKPPLYILESYKQKNGNVSVPTSVSQTLGPTDFNYPQINVKYGTDTEQKLSLDLGKTGFEIEEQDRDDNASAEITTLYNGVEYSTKIFIRKEFNVTNNTPYLCLYETVKDTNGIDRSFKIECVERTLPEIAGSVEVPTSTRQVIISDPQPSNKYYDADISIRYKADFPTDGITNATTDEIILKNETQNIAQCNSQVEKYKVCAQREECNKLTNECVQNEINIQNSPAGSNIDALLAIRNDCNTVLLERCDRKKGITASTTYNNAYGWFNELCISSGFESKLKNVLAYKLADASIMGKCVIDTTRSTGSCNKGGKPQENGSTMDNCICVQANETSDTNLYIRKQTPREAGLCIDLPVPELCSATLYNHVSDSIRTAATAVGNADFITSAFGGMNNVTGLCKGNWTYQKNPSTGADLLPTMNCVTSDTGITYWDTSSLQNHCVRYSCNQIYSEPRLNNSNEIEYTNGYGLENKDYDATASLTKGYQDGFALWPQTTSDDDGQTATGICITGYQAVGAAPSRLCSPQGHWQTVNNACQRIMCPAINPTNPSQYDPDTQHTQWNSAWQAWSDAGGATFNATPASRIAMLSDTDSVAPDSVAQGTCNESLGFFQGGIYPPTFKCDANGTWRGLTNPCVTKCDEITVNSPYNINNGNALWHEGSVAIGQSNADGEFNGCVAGYVPYPYSAPKNKYGVDINSTTDPQNPATRLYADATSSNPQRVCYSVYNAGTYATYWGTAYPACTNKCPGAATDARVGVGITKHRLSNGSYEYIEWADANPGETQIRYSGTTQQDIEHYYNGNSGTYAVKRVCGPDYKWITYTNAYGQREDVKPQCVAKDLIVNSDNENINGSNAVFGGTNDTIDEGTSITANYCITGYDTENSQKPQYECIQKDANRHIDEFYYSQKSGSPTCIKKCYAVNGNSYGNGSKYDGTTGYFFPEEEVNLVCRTNYGHKPGQATCTSGSGGSCVYNNGVYQCGRKIASANSRIMQNPTMKCQSDGTWTVTNDCTQCNACTCSNGNCGNTPYPFIFSVDNPKRVAYCTRADNDDSYDDDVFTSGPYTKNDVGCGNSGDKTRNIYPDTVLSGSFVTKTAQGSDNPDTVTWKFSCYDGLFTVEQTATTGDSGGLRTYNK